VLKGAFVFLSDLVRHMPGHVSMDFMAVSSYAKGTTSSGEVRLQRISTRRWTVRTSSSSRHRRYRPDAHLSAGHPARAKIRETCGRRACLSKPSRRQVNVKVEYIGFTIEDRFVVGYGLDYAEQYRNLPHIAVVGS